MCVGRVSDMNMVNDGGITLKSSTYAYDFI